MRSILESPGADRFFNEFWQKKPLPFTAASLPPFTEDRNSLAWLAMQPEVDSRLIKLTDGFYTNRYGPFSEKELTALPHNNWTILINSLDTLLDEAAAFYNLFTGFALWRLDDIMVSFAAEGGGVGPHLDRYDVFLIQLSGERLWQWQTGQIRPADEVLEPGHEVRILSGFRADNEQVMQPGDVLYLPPGIAHNGIALDSDCITLSVGFRAVAAAGILRKAADMLEEQPPLADPEPPGFNGRFTLPEEFIDHYRSRVSDLCDERILEKAIASAASETRRYTLEVPEEPLTFSELKTEGFLMPAPGLRVCCLNNSVFAGGLEYSENYTEVFSLMYESLKPVVIDIREIKNTETIEKLYRLYRDGVMVRAESIDQ